MATFTKGKTFMKGKKTVMYIYKGGKKTARRLVAANHKLARNDKWIVAKAAYKVGKRHADRRNSRR